MFGQSLLSAFGIACTTDTDQLFTVPTSSSTVATYELNSNANSIPYNTSATSIATYQLNSGVTSIPNNTYPGTATSISYAAGKFGNAAVFDGSSSDIIISGLSSMFSTKAAFTVSLWFKTTATGNRALFDDYTSNNYNIQLYLYDGILNVSTRFSGGDGNMTASSTTYNDGNWHHVAVTSNQTTYNTYVDGGSPITWTPSSNSHSGQTPTVTTGASQGGTVNFFSGEIDQVRIFNTALPQVAITALYNETTTTAQNDYISYAPSYNGTASNITYAAGKFDNAAVFNGLQNSSGSKIEIPQAVFNDGALNTLSVSAWFKSSITSQSQTILSTQPASSNTGFAVFLANSTGYLRAQFSAATGSGAPIMEYQVNMADGNWHNVVIAYNDPGGTNNASSYMYVDGVNVTSSVVGLSGWSQGSVPTWSSFTTNRVNLGMYFDGTNYIDTMNGSIDQVRIFNSVLSQNVITALYNETTTTAQSNNIDYLLPNPNSIAYYKMADATDQLGNYNGTATNVNFNIQGKFGFAGKFDGSSSLITLPSGLNKNNNFSWSFWINFDALTLYSSTIVLQDTYRNLIDLDGAAGGSAGAGSLHFYDGVSLSSPAGTVTTGTWYHVVITKSSSTGRKMYVNNAVVASDSSTTNSISGSGQNMIGAYNSGSSTALYLNGKIDQIRIYDSAISAADVTTLYKEVECEPAAINALANFNTVLYTGNSSTNIINTVGFKPGLTWIKGRNYVDFHALFDTVRGVPGNNIASNSSNQQGTNTTTLTSFDTSGFTLGSDATQQVNYDTKTYVAWNWKAPLANLSTSFNGSSSKIQLPSGVSVATGNNNFTISTWVYLNAYNSSGTQYSTIITTQANQYFYVAIAGTGLSGQGLSTGEVMVSNNQAVSGDPVSGYVTASTGVVPLNTWTHIAVTLSSTAGTKIYINGNLDTTQSSRTQNASSMSANSYMGAYNSGSTDENYLNGKIDQVRMFNTVLTASQVSDLYAEPAASNNTLNYPAGAGCIAAYPLQTDAVDLSGNYSGTSSNVTFGQPGYLTSNTDGTITSTVAANTEAGFSVVKYTGNGTAGAKVGHSLGVTPNLIFVKSLDDVRNWIVGSGEISWSKILQLDLDDAEATYSGFNNTAPTSSVFSIGSNNPVNASGIQYIAYCIASIPGYSKIGSYVGTGATGNFQYIGFEPSVLLIKNTTSTGWWNLSDSKRGANKSLFPNDTYQEVDDTGTQRAKTFNSTGFTLNGNNGDINGSGNTYIFLAIA